MEDKELTREQRLDLEESAINALLQMGVKFSVPLKIEPKRPPKAIRWWNKHFPNHLKIWRDRRLPKAWSVSTKDMPDVDNNKLKKVYMRDLRVKPLYLGTIDRLRQLYIEIEYNEETIQNAPIQESKKLFRYIPLMAEIAAVAVINNPTISDPLNKEVKELKAFFMEHLTVARLQKLADVISQMMNPGGFTNSIRSIREIGTTKPNPTKATDIE